MADDLEECSSGLVPLTENIATTKPGAGILMEEGELSVGDVAERMGASVANLYCPCRQARRG